MKSLIKIGTRKSELALWQAHYVSDKLTEIHPNIDIELVKIVSQGDKTLDVPLSKVGGKGLFLKELELALLDGSIDIAVHSMKDVTVDLPKGLDIPVVCAREDPRDAFVSQRYHSLSQLPDGAVVGTCSLRRRCQLLAHFPHLQVENLRGNVNTRLSRLDAGDYDAIILAAAGLKRLKFEDRIRDYLSTELFLPAVGQGVVGIECREDDGRINDLIRPLSDSQTQITITAERTINRALNGGCHVPIAAYAWIDNETLCVKGLVGELDGRNILVAYREGRLDQAEKLGEAVAADLLSQGAGDILNIIYDKS